jgi:hypothetical protein
MAEGDVKILAQNLLLCKDIDIHSINYNNESGVE